MPTQGYACPVCDKCHKPLHTGIPTQINFKSQHAPEITQYCNECAPAILERAAAKLPGLSDQIEQALEKFRTGRKIPKDIWDNLSIHEQESALKRHQRRMTWRVEGINRPAVEWNPSRLEQHLTGGGPTRFLRILGKLATAITHMNVMWWPQRYRDVVGRIFQRWAFQTQTYDDRMELRHYKAFQEILRVWPETAPLFHPDNPKPRLRIPRHPLVGGWGHNIGAFPQYVPGQRLGQWVTCSNGYWLYIPWGLK